MRLHDIVENNREGMKIAIRSVLSSSHSPAQLWQRGVGGDFSRSFSKKVDANV
jgi:hypothetical protein